MFSVVSGGFEGKLRHQLDSEVTPPESSPFSVGSCANGWYGGLFRGPRRFQSRRSPKRKCLALRRWLSPSVLVWS